MTPEPPRTSSLVTEDHEVSKWVWNALNEQTGKINQIASEVHDISTTLKRSWPEGDPANHWKEHELFKERELERQRLEANRLVREEEKRAFWMKIKADALAYALNAIGLFIVGLIVLGTQTKFKEWVQWAATEETKQEKSK
jgi:AraC-like DNA-binding protein